MSQAWIRLRAAVHILGQEGTPRERLTAAFSLYLLGLKPKEMPPEVRDKFIKLMGWASHLQREAKRTSVESALRLAKDSEVTSMIDLIIDMYDAVTRYEPILARPNPQPARRRYPANDLASAA